MPYACFMDTNAKTNLGRQKGGRARAKSLSPEQRTEIAVGAAKARWARRSTQIEAFPIDDLMMNTDVIDAADMLVTELSEQAAILSESGVAALTSGKFNAVRLLVDAIERTTDLRLRAEELKGDIAKLHGVLAPNQNAPQKTGLLTEEFDKSAEARRQDRTDPVLMNAKRDSIIRAMESKYAARLRRWSAAMYRDDQKNFRLVCTMSKWHSENQTYWYAYHPHQDEFLVDAAEGFFVLGMMNLDSAVVLPRNIIQKNLEKLNTTEIPGGRKYWHIHIARSNSGELFLQRARGERPLLLEQFTLKVPL
jgi:hypothetical protein